jgi:O-antigen/teichoic acid export membrane protein
MNFITKLFRHELISGSIYIFLGTTIASFLAFLLNMFYARTLSYADYGTYSSLLSIITLLVIPCGALTAVIVRYATQFFTKGENERAGAFYKKSFIYLFVFVLILFFGLILLYPVTSKFLKINEFGFIVLTGLAVAISYLANLNIAFIQSLLRFRLMGSIYVIAGLARIIGGVFLVYLGFRVWGALASYVILAVVYFFISVIPLKSVIKNAGREVNIGTKDFTSYAIPTSIAILSLSSFISTDVLLVKHFFGAAEAGFYGGLSLVGKVIFYFTGPIAIVMFPLIVKKHAQNEKYNKLFYSALTLVLLASLAITTFYFLFPEFTIKLFLGGRGYLVMVPFLGIFGIFLTIFSLNNVFVNFFLSIKRTLVWTIVLFWAIAQILGIWFFHGSFDQVIYVSIITSLLLLGSLVLYYLKINENSRSKKPTQL